MAYETGTASSLSDLLSKLTTFLTTYGWSVHDQLSASDVVVCSTGTDGRKKIYIRLSDGSALRDYSLGYGVSMHDYFAQGAVADRCVISCRAYQSWDSVAHTGQQEASGQLGGFSLYAPGYSRPYIYRCRGVTDSTPDGEGVHTMLSYGAFFVGDPNDTAYNAACWLPRFLEFQQGAVGYNPRYYPWRSGVTTEGDMVAFLSMASFFHGFDTRIATSCFAHGSHIPVFNGKDLWVYAAFSNASYYWMKRRPSDSGSGAWTKCANPPWAPSSSYVGPRGVCWDGQDTIYVTRGADSNNFAKYSISGDSWTALNNTPQTWAAGNLFYYPNSESGLGADRIYAFSLNGGGVYYFDVSTGNWSANVGSVPSSARSGGPCWINGGNKILFAHSTTTAYYYYTVTTGAYTQLSNLPANCYRGGEAYVNRYVCDLHIQTGVLQNYHFFCDKHHFKIAVEHTDGRWFWTYAGEIDPFNKREFAVTTSQSDTGDNVVVSVDRTLTAQAGDWLMILDPSGSYQDQLEVVACGTNTITFSSVEVAIPEGSLVGEDPLPVGVFSQNAEKWFPTNYPRKLLNEEIVSDLPGGFTPYYEVRPSTWPDYASFYWDGYVNFSEVFAGSTTITDGAGNARTGQYDLLPFIVRNNQSDMEIMRESRGTLYGAYAISQHGSATSGDIVQFNGENYLVLKSDDGPGIGYGAVRSYCVCLGPMH